MDGNDATLSYTSMQRRKETRAKKHDEIRHMIEFDAGLRGNDNVRLPTVPLPPRSTLDFAAYTLYSRYFFNPETCQHKQDIYGRTVFRQLKFSKYVLKQKSEAKFVCKVKMKYGQPENNHLYWGLVTGYSQISCTNEDPRLKMFQRAGFNVLLVNEYKTSSVCPTCHQESLETFMQRPSPRPWREGAIVTVHGLLRCKSEICQQFVNGQLVPRLWNRDRVATLNIRSVVDETICQGVRPIRFSRRNPPN